MDYAFIFFFVREGNNRVHSEEYARKTEMEL